MRAPAGAWLYVPAHRPRFLEKSLGTGAAAIIVDLEDGVPQDEKREARKNARWFLERLEPSPASQVWLRVGSDPASWREDLRACGGSAGLAGVLVPKANSADDLRGVSEVWRGPLALLVETASCLANIANMCEFQGLEVVAIGEQDLQAALETSLTEDDPVLDHVRLTIVAAARAAGIRTIVGPVQTSIDDIGALVTSSKRLRQLGVSARAVIHPTHVLPVNSAIAPPGDEFAWANSVLEGAGRLDVSVVDGEFVDAAVLRRARLIVRGADECS